MRDSTAAGEWRPVQSVAWREFRIIYEALTRSRINVIYANSECRLPRSKEVHSAMKSLQTCFAKGFFYPPLINSVSVVATANSRRRDAKKGNEAGQKRARIRNEWRSISLRLTMVSPAEQYSSLFHPQLLYKWDNNCREVQ